MRAFRIRNDLQRAKLNGFALPLGLVPENLGPPEQGYTLDYTPGEDEEPDTYAFQVVVSHERLPALIDRVFRLLSAEVCGIIEIGSRDAYRTTDVYMASEPIPREDFLWGWHEYEKFLLEDGSISAGVNSEEPFMEVFLDQWKGLTIHVPLLMREDIEQLLNESGLNEVGQTWPDHTDELTEDAVSLRPVLALDDEYSPDVDELLMQLRHVWKLELNIDPEVNVDDAGRELGRTLWHAMLVVQSVNEPDEGAYCSIWATARSLTDMEYLIRTTLETKPEWRFADVYTIDRIAFDERPPELTDLAPRRSQTETHLVEFDTWTSDPEDPPAGQAEDVD